MKNTVRLPLAHVLARAFRLSSRRAGVVLVYHRLAEEPGEPDELLPAVGAELFAAHTRHLAGCYRAVPASEILEAVARRRRGQRFPVAVTFDDDLASHVHVALPILRRNGVPATFFLCGASLREPFEFWWERLQRVVDREGVEPLRSLTAGDDVADEPETIHDLARAIEAMSRQRRQAVTAALADRLGEPAPDAGLRAEDVTALVASGCEVGFHTLHHDALPLLADGELQEALHEGRQHLASLVGHDVSVIAYPHGRADQRVASAARAAGYRIGFTCSGDVVRADADPLVLGRIFPPATSLGHFALQLVRMLATSERSR